MKSMPEIKKLPRIVFDKVDEDGFKAHVLLLSTKQKNRAATVVASWGCGWDHVSVSFTNRTPTWEEMAEVKEMFFKPDEVCFQFHPAETDYVNYHPYCLHIWRCQETEIPTPPYWMVGPKKGQSFFEHRRIAMQECRRWEEEHRAKP